MWKGFLVISSILIAILSVFLPENLARIHNYVYTSVVPLLIVAVSLIVYVHTQGEIRRITLAVILMSLLNWLGEITWNYYEIINLIPSPSLADVFWIMAYLPIIYILLTILKDRIRYVSLSGYLLAAFFIAIAVVLVLVPALHYAEESLSPIEAFVTNIYILLDIVLIPPLILLFMVYLKRPMGMFYGGLILSATLTLIGDILYNYYDIWGIYYTGSLPDAFYNLSYLVLLFTMLEVYRRNVRIVTIEDIEREKAKFEFLNKLMRHDILNDLSAVLGYLEIFKQSKNPEILDKIETRIKNSINLIKSVRTVEKKPEIKPVDLKEVVLSEAHGYGNVKIDVDVPDVKVLADDLLASVLRNLVINAIVHSDEKIPKIEISAKRLNGWIEIRVADNGPGIPDDMKEEIFREGIGKHSGLGLFLVKKIVESYGGKIWVEDNRPKGSVFVIRLRAA